MNPEAFVEVESVRSEKRHTLVEQRESLLELRNLLCKVEAKARVSSSAGTDGYVCCLLLTLRL